MARWRLAFLMLGLVGLLLAGGSAGASAVSAQDGAYQWALLGPAGPARIAAVAAADDWQTGGLLIAARADDLVRSLDAGLHWEALPLPGPGITSLHIITTPSGRVVLATYGRPGQEMSRALLRSVDDGATWQRVLELDVTASGYDGGKVVPSPAAAQDGLTFALLVGRLFRSDDAGATWTAVEPVPEQRVQAVEFSPAFAQDRTIYLAVISGDFPSVTANRPAGLSNDHERSIGVMVSTDAGLTWAASSTGLTVDGDAYRHVQSLAISPTFDRDGTLFVGAWGPRPPSSFGSGTIYLPRTAIFRSRDRGMTWQRIGARADRRTQVAMSPSFADDGVALLSASGEFITPASHSCTVYRTADGGDAWEQVIRPASYDGCSDLRMVGGGADPLAVVFKGVGWTTSRDGGRTWEGLNPPSGVGAQRVSLSPTGAGHRSPLVFGTGYGLWALGVDVQQTAGTLPCSTEATGGFGRVYAEQVILKARLGCPLTPEEPVTLRVMIPAGPGTEGAFTVEDGSLRWLVLNGSHEGRDGAWWTPGPGSKPLPDGLDVIGGVRQEFDGGTLYFFVQANGARTILATGARGAGSGWWLAYPD